MIVKRKDGYYVVSHKDQRNLGGPYKSKYEANKRLAQIRAFSRDSDKGK
jgi:hypothetical protein